MSIRYIKNFETEKEQKQLMEHLNKLGVKYDHGIMIRNGHKTYYVKAFN